MKNAVRKARARPTPSSGNSNHPAGYHWVNFFLHAVNVLFVDALVSQDQDLVVEGKTGAEGIGKCEEGQERQGQWDVDPA
jgi:hypothetical protein